jgi:hypothetical protein
MSTKKRRTHSPITGKRYPKCSTSGCNNNVYADGKCYGHQSNPVAPLGGSSERQDRSSGVRLSGPGPRS